MSPPARPGAWRKARLPATFANESLLGGNRLGGGVRERFLRGHEGGFGRLLFAGRLGGLVLRILCGEGGSFGLPTSRNASGRATSSRSEELDAGTSRAHRFRMAKSRTAEFVAFYRALETTETAREPLFRDPLAGSFLSGALRLALSAARARPLRAVLVRYADWRAPGARTSAIGRTRFIDE